MLVVSLTLIALIVVLYFVISNIVLSSFSDLEEDDVRENVGRVNEALSNELDEMAVKAKGFALPGTQEELDRLVKQLEINDGRVTPEGLSGTVDQLVNRLGGVNVFLLADAAGGILWGWGYDEEKEKITLVPASLRTELKNPQSRLIQHPGDATSLKGIIRLPEGPMLIVSEYRLNSAGGGHIGSALIGKYLEEEEVARLEELTSLSVEIHEFDDAAAPADVQEVRSSLTDGSMTLVRTLKNESGDDRVAGYTQVADINGNPGLLMRVDMARDIVDKGRDSLLFLLISLVVVGLVLIGLIAFLLNRLVLSRLARLDTEVGSIHGGAQDLSQRVTAQGNDELSRLGTSINGMLGEIQVERDKSEGLLLNVLPQPIADRLKQGESTIADSFPGVTVLFADVVGFTPLSARVSATELVALLNQVFSVFDGLTDQHGLEKIKTIGDAYMVVGGLPSPGEDHAEVVAEMALGIQEALPRFNEEHGSSLRLRIGINSGPVVAGVIGTKKFIYDLWGDTVNTASRMESHGVEDHIQVTEETYRLLNDKYEFEERGVIDVKGKGDMSTYFLKGKKVTVAQPSGTVGGES